MATTDVDICNAALVLIGKPAAITSLTDGSVAASNCAALYHQALSTCLAEHAWSFATVTVLLSLVASPNQLWSYAYESPGDMVQPLALYEYDAQGDVMGTYSAPYSVPVGLAGFYPVFSGLQGGTQQDFAVESAVDGTSIILTNQANAILRYVRFVTSAANLPPLFVSAFSCMLASNLAGAMIKGDVGVSAVKSLLQTYSFWMSRAKESDAANRRVGGQGYVAKAILARGRRG